MHMEQQNGGFKDFINYRLRPLPAILAIVMVVGFGYMGYTQYTMQKELASQKEMYSEKIASLAEEVDLIESVLTSAQEENEYLARAFEEAKERSDSLENQFERVNDNVQTLEKITTTDPELLQKYSRIFFLNEHYAPEDLTTIPSKYTYNEDRTYEIHSDVWPFLEDLLEEAEDDNVDIKVISAFRSFGEQAQLKGAYTVTYGAGSANQFSADQGYSEHQLGTTVDFTNSTVGATFSGFAASDTYKWLQDNAYKYGFTLSYPEDNSYYVFEPWHWRFVGKDLARRLHRNEDHFYDLDQRTIDSYIAELFDR